MNPRLSVHVQPASDWNPSLYMKFADERMLAARDLLARVPQASARLVYDLGGVVTFTHFTCQPRCALKDRKEENQAVRGPAEVGANSTKNGLFLASVTMPAGHIRATSAARHAPSNAS